MSDNKNPDGQPGVLDKITFGARQVARDVVDHTRDVAANAMDAAGRAMLSPGRTAENLVRTGEEGVEAIWAAVSDFWTFGQRVLSATTVGADAAVQSFQASGAQVPHRGADAGTASAGRVLSPNVSRTNVKAEKAVCEESESESEEESAQAGAQDAPQGLSNS